MKNVMMGKNKAAAAATEEELLRQHDASKQERFEKLQQINVTQSNPEQERDNEAAYFNKSDGQILDDLETGVIPQHQLETLIGNTERAVKLRRMYFAGQVGGTQGHDAMSNLPYEHYNYDEVFGVNCENVVGYVQLPVGVVGPLTVDGKPYYIPLATTEGCLIASAQRGAKAISTLGANSVILNDGMTRGPVMEMPNAKECARFKEWLEKEENYDKVCQIFNSTSRFGRIQSIKVAIAGRKMFLRFKCRTGDAMGMNMISKGVTKVLQFLSDTFPQLRLLSVSGNYCTDKKPSAINWIEGRGKSVVVDAVIPKDVVKTVLKTNVNDLVKLNVDKNLIGSAMAGSIGGFNAHSANLVAALYIACGQDPAQVVESSTCITLMEKTDEGDLYISVSMPSIEVGSIGGGTNLKAQQACLKMLGVQGANPEEPGKNAQQLARLVGSIVMCGELSLMSALASNDLVKAHMNLNRKNAQQLARLVGSIVMCGELSLMSALASNDLVKAHMNLNRKNAQQLAR
eukprot:CAMPEP_0117424182 /NCGR_PEP_ID=MMETSP0758-20121206/4653_1 /TAXON_ID=63605 /ORGANISM="Percolomonas cosmopolitus, Strain AE-1 (ATCC 50343)" /LENGTH=514 /DNA_ID=CAMNT_0005207809 /DNA_START=318 /DNA_END=1858 /DNA_ORIENTATION=+